MRAEPQPGLGGEAAHVASYLAFYRATVVEKARSLLEADLRRPLVPTGWTPLELVQHLAFMERRWFAWGFLGEAVADPWGDSQGSSAAAWLVPSSVSLDDVVARLTEQAARTEAVLSSTPLEQLAATTGRFRTDPPELRYICFHVLHEYARHAGHLDVAVELAGGPVGE
ncbi:MAG TPA: DUF664 domain-containing protein [Nocardioides sp.]|uniref:mycothiol transferase n=1 Tax=Nocardioides sp. TaxID=35761 RepID=UPI002E37F459|nr:DUF664 domain-containing protein [Nocardioides sp.]HEX5088846.1 DUF664 domain-containing protein [Nocardioides sp.]